MVFLKSWTDIKKPLSIIFIKLRTFFIWVFFGVLTGVACGVLGGCYIRPFCKRKTNPFTAAFWCYFGSGL